MGRAKEVREEGGGNEGGRRQHVSIFQPIVFRDALMCTISNNIIDYCFRFQLRLLSRFSKFSLTFLISFSHHKLVQFDHCVRSTSS